MISVKSLVEGSSAAEEAKKKGLRYIGYGRWADKNNSVVAKTIDGKLKMLNKPERPGSYKQANKTIDRSPSSVTPDKAISKIHARTDANSGIMAQLAKRVGGHDRLENLIALKRAKLAKEIKTLSGNDPRKTELMTKLTKYSRLSDLTKRYKHVDKIQGLNPDDALNRDVPAEFDDWENFEKNRRDVNKRNTRMQNLAWKAVDAAGGFEPVIRAVGEKAKKWLDFEKNEKIISKKLNDAFNSTRGGDTYVVDIDEALNSVDEILNSDLIDDSEFKAELKRAHDVLSGDIQSENELSDVNIALGNALNRLDDLANSDQLKLKKSRYAQFLKDLQQLRNQYYDYQGRGMGESKKF